MLARPSERVGAETSRGALGAPLHDGAEDYDEISLVDIIRVIHKRRLILATIIILSLAAGGAVTLFTTPQYAASTTVIPLAHPEILKSWLESRQAAVMVAGDAGTRLYPVLFPGEWDPASESWVAGAPSDEEIGQKLRSHVKITTGAGGTQGRSQDLLFITATLPDAVMARDVAQAYVGTLGELRPQLENLTRAEQFDKYYDGTNEQDAQRQAETSARQKTYWIVFDSPTVPDSPSEPRPALYMTLSAVFGIVLGIFAVFGVEWLSRFRAEFERVEAPPE